MKHVTQGGKVVGVAIRVPSLPEAGVFNRICDLKDWAEMKDLQGAVTNALLDGLVVESQVIVYHDTWTNLVVKIHEVTARRHANGEEARREADRLVDRLSDGLWESFNERLTQTVNLTDLDLLNPLHTTVAAKNRFVAGELMPV